MIFLVMEDMCSSVSLAQFNHLIPSHSSWQIHVLVFQGAVFQLTKNWARMCHVEFNRHIRRTCMLFRTKERTWKDKKRLLYLLINSVRSHVSCCNDISPLSCKSCIPFQLQKLNRYAYSCLVFAEALYLIFYL